MVTVKTRATDRMASPLCPRWWRPPGTPMNIGKLKWVESARSLYPVATSALAAAMIWSRPTLASEKNMPVLGLANSSLSMSA